MKLVYCEICGVETNEKDGISVKAKYILCKLCVLEVFHAMMGKAMK